MLFLLLDFSPVAKFSYIKNYILRGYSAIADSAHSHETS